MPLVATVTNVVRFPGSGSVRDLLEQISEDADNLDHITIVSIDKSGQVTCSWADATPERLALALFVFEATLRDMLRSEEVLH